MLKSVASLLISTAVITTGVVVVELSSEPHLAGSDIFGAAMMLFLIVLGFSALGLFLLLPLAILLIRNRATYDTSTVALAILAAPIGYILLACVADQNRWVGGVAGAITMLSWSMLNATSSKPRPQKTC